MSNLEVEDALRALHEHTRPVDSTEALPVLGPAELLAFGGLLAAARYRESMSIWANTHIEGAAQPAAADIFRRATHGSELLELWYRDRGAIVGPNIGTDPLTRQPYQYEGGTIYVLEEPAEEEEQTEPERPKWLTIFERREAS